MRTLAGRRKIIDVSGILLAFAQIALGLSGFSAILVALGGSPDQWTPVDSFRIRNMLTFSFQAIFIALVPVLLTLFAVPEPALWQISLIVLGTATLGGALLVYSGFRRLSQPERMVLRPPLVYSVLTVLLTASLLELAATMGSRAAAPGPFFAGLLVLLGVSVYLIIRFLFARPAA